VPEILFCSTESLIHSLNQRLNQRLNEQLAQRPRWRPFCGPVFQSLVVLLFSFALAPNQARAQAQTSSSALSAIQNFIKQLESNQATPAEVRSQFNQLFLEARNQHDKRKRSEQEAFSEQSRRERDAKIKELKGAREASLAKAQSSFERSELNAKQDAAHKKFFALDEAQSREFSTALREEQKQFDQSMTATRSDFEKSYKVFVERYYANKKTIDAQKESDRAAQKQEAKLRAQGAGANQTPEDRAILKEFEPQKKQPTIRLEPNDSN